MKSILAAVALFLAGAVAQDSSFMINTPSNVVECEPTLLSWMGGNAPFFLSVLPGASPSGPAIESFPTTNSSSVTWVVNIQSGTSIGFTLRDSTGATAQSAAVTVNAGSSTSCLNTTSVVPGPTVASSPAASSSAASEPTGETTTPGSSAGTGTATGTSSGTSASPTSSSSGASANVAQLGAAGIVGAAVVALFL